MADQGRIILQNYYLCNLSMGCMQSMYLTGTRDTLRYSSVTTNNWNAHCILSLFKNKVPKWLKREEYLKESIAYQSKD